MPLNSGKHAAPSLLSAAPCALKKPATGSRTERNASLRAGALHRSKTAPPLAAALVKIRASVLAMTRLEFARKSGIARGTLRDLELGMHTPTRKTLQRFVTFCQSQQVEPALLENLHRQYVGEIDSLGRFIASLELLAGSPRTLARKVGISPATLWEYRRGRFPIALSLLRNLCAVVNGDQKAAELLWHDEERRRLLARGYPRALAEFWLLCARAGYAEKHVLRLGISTATARQMRYLEIPDWDDVSKVAQTLCRDDKELEELRRLWTQDAFAAHGRPPNRFGPALEQLRKQKGIARRELADLFGIGGKKPARIIKYIEEDGFYSTQAYPAGLVAVLAHDAAQSARLGEFWRKRRRQFHLRHRPETRIELRLTREYYGFEIRDMKAVLGYDNLEYQKIERGITPLRETAATRIQDAIVQAGERKVDILRETREEHERARLAWKCPEAVSSFISLLIERQGGLIPLARHLRDNGVHGLWPGRLRAIALGQHLPAWYTLARVGEVCCVADLSQAQLDWTERYRAMLLKLGIAPLGAELRLLMAQHAATLRGFSPRLGFNYSVLVRDMQRIDRDQPGRWFHIERILRGAGLSPQDERWKEIRVLWYTADVRRSLRRRSQNQGLGARARRRWSFAPCPSSLTPRH